MSTLRGSYGSRSAAVSAACVFAGGHTRLDNSPDRVVQVAPGVLRRSDATGSAYQLTKNGAAWDVAELTAGELTAALAAERVRLIAEAQAELDVVNDRRAELEATIVRNGGTPRVR